MSFQPEALSTVSHCAVSNETKDVLTSSYVAVGGEENITAATLR